MFGPGSRVVLFINSTRPGTAGQRVALPGVVVSPPFQSSFQGRNGAQIPQQRASIVTLRTSVDGKEYAKLSDESLVFLAPRGGELVKGLDVDGETGEILSVPAIRQLAVNSLQQYLVGQAAAMPAVAEQAATYAGEPLAPAPLG